MPLTSPGEVKRTSRLSGDFWKVVKPYSRELPSGVLTNSFDSNTPSLKLFIILSTLPRISRPLGSASATVGTSARKTARRFMRNVSYSALGPGSDPNLFSNAGTSKQVKKADNDIDSPANQPKSCMTG